MRKLAFIGKNEPFESNVIKELESSGFEIIVYRNSAEAMQKIGSSGAEMILISLEQEDGDGIEMCCKVREQMPSHYVALVSGHVEAFVKVAAIEAGADDYFQFPMNKRFLVAKLLAWIKKREQAHTQEQVNDEFEGLRIDRESFAVYIDDKKFEVPKKEFEILSLLIAEPRKVFTRDQIKKLSWDEEEIVRDRTIDVHIRKLREKIGDRYIKTIRGVGYKLEV